MTGRFDFLGRLSGELPSRLGGRILSEGGAFTVDNIVDGADDQQKDQDHRQENGQHDPDENCAFHSIHLKVSVARTRRKTKAMP